MTTIGDRIRVARKRVGLSQSALASQIGVTSQAVNQWESGKSQPARDNLLGICRFTSVSLHELMFNENSINLFDDNFNNDTLPSEHGGHARGPVSERGQRKVLLVDLKAAVTGSFEVGHFPEICASFPVGKRAFAIEVPNDSNYPLLPRETRAVFDPDVEQIPGSFVLAALNGEAVIGRLKLEARSGYVVSVVEPVNPAWPAARSDNGEFHIAATLVEATVRASDLMRVTPRQSQ